MEQVNTIRELFEKNKNITIRIPEYQRSYSWEEKQCKQFLDDLIEQKGKPYYLGQFLFEEDLNNKNKLYIIDGQQRLTTVVIFFAVVSKMFKEQGYNNDIDKIYLGDKFETTKLDNNIFENIKKHNSLNSVNKTKSEYRIKEMFKYFEKKIKPLNKVEIDNIIKSLEKAKVHTYIVADKIESVQIFEYQNDRGKVLTKFEVLKSFLMLQIYIENYRSDKANHYIDKIQNKLEPLYENIQSLNDNFSEDFLLDSTCFLFYKRDGSVEKIKTYWSENKIENKTDWIIDFFENILNMSSYAIDIQEDEEKNEFIRNLFLFGDKIKWKIVLLSLYFKEVKDGTLFDKILKLLEILSLKMSLGDFRTDKLDEYSYTFFNSKEDSKLERIFNEIKNATENGFQWYWKDNNNFDKIVIKNFIKIKHHYYYSNITKYILWQYENTLRKEKMASVLKDKKDYKKYTIEHIQPKNPKNGNTKKFEEDYLHLIGNLSLLTQSQNSKYSNKPFEEKKELYQETTLISYTEIRKNKIWTEEEIEERTKKILKFVEEYFSIEKL